MCIKNYGDISKANSIKMKDDIDLFTYSFPCTDISMAGTQKGLTKGSGTRSGLLWECEKFIQINNPKVLLMENVKALVGNKFISDFNEWKLALEGMGYNSYWQILNSKDYNIPQNRERVFMISIRKDVDISGYKFEVPANPKPQLKDILENAVDDKYYLTNQEIINIYKWKAYEKPLVKIHGVDNIGKCLTARGAGECHSGMFLLSSLHKDILNLNAIISDDIQHSSIGKNDVFQDYTYYKVRKLTPRESWRMMGFEDVAFDNCRPYMTDTMMYKQAGNSIVTNCLESIFKNLNYIIKGGN